MRQVSCIKLFTSAYIKMHKVNKKKQLKDINKKTYQKHF